MPKDRRCVRKSASITHLWSCVPHSGCPKLTTRGISMVKIIIEMLPLLHHIHLPAGWLLGQCDAAVDDKVFKICWETILQGSHMALHVLQAGLLTDFVLNLLFKEVQVTKNFRRYSGSLQSKMSPDLLSTIRHSYFLSLGFLWFKAVHFAYRWHLVLSPPFCRNRRSQENYSILQFLWNSNRNKKKSTKT